MVQLWKAGTLDIEGIGITAVGSEGNEVDLRVNQAYQDRVPREYALGVEGRPGRSSSAVKPHSEVDVCSGNKPHLGEQCSVPDGTSEGARGTPESRGIGSHQLPVSGNIRQRRLLQPGQRVRVREACH